MKRKSILPFSWQNRRTIGIEADGGKEEATFSITIILPVSHKWQRKVKNQEEMDGAIRSDQLDFNVGVILWSSASNASDGARKFPVIVSRKFSVSGSREAPAAWRAQQVFEFNCLIA
jgi:hypothetical protein